MKPLNANELFDLMIRTEIETEKEEKRTGKPFKMTLSGLRKDIAALRQAGLIK